MIFVVIPVHNRKQLTRACLQCLKSQTVRNFKVVVVDDGSTDGTDLMIQNEFPDVVRLTGDGNLWWTEGTNVGVRYALANKVAGEDNFVLTLNDDTEVPDDYVETLLSNYYQYAPCLLGSVSVDIKKHDSLQFAGTRMNLHSAYEQDLAYSRYQNSYAYLKRQTPFIESDSLPGRGILIPFEVFDKVGLFDSRNFVHYMADIEFTVRARRAGYRLILPTNTVVFEHVDTSGLKVRADLTFNKFWRGLWSKYSPINLGMRYAFAMRHAPTKWLYFSFDVGRIFIGYALRRMRVMESA
ncbi:glycosyltransferase family 2 protein [Spirosoma taeanense]|uniref:Glycosyltransferase family 2 protein n=1 Tax=Spirosoma taeanense TaxID=2735870 RepID=A0A6M5Y3Q0_9BACT|nr:glycosyltransferase family 2 protein [Spirosoma taeanense]QJW88000.1 glycosyltransferase family 2 protein [Spirosoma taeanense]